MAFAACQNCEQWLLEAEDDEGNDRPMWMIERCPLTGCSTDSWRRAAVWSYESEDRVYSYFKRHLMMSSLHQPSEEDADQVIAEGNFEIKIELETFDEREAYRKSMSQQAKKKRSAEEAASGSGSKAPKSAPKSAAKSSRPGPKTDAPGDITGMQGAIAESLQAAVLQGLKPLQDIVASAASASSSGSAPASLAIQPRMRMAGVAEALSPMATQLEPNIPVPARQAHMLHDSLNRAAYAARQSADLCNKLSRQFADEAAVMEHAKEPCACKPATHVQWQAALCASDVYSGRPLCVCVLL